MYRKRAIIRGKKKRRIAAVLLLFFCVEKRVANATFTYLGERGRGEKCIRGRR